jgi:phospholipid/cholesterol/gamma-HCH transport system permease protein
MSPTRPILRSFNAIQLLGGIGAGAERTLAYVGGLAALIGKASSALVYSPLKRGRRLQRAVHQAMIAGVQAVPIITLITFFVGVIIALQGAYGLQRLGAMHLIAGLVAISITRELGPLVAAIVVIGRSGSAFAAEIGAMRVSEELDALKTMALNPIDFLVAPKLAAMAVMLPCLTIWSDLMGVLGGALFGVAGAGFTFGGYFIATREALALRDVTTGIAKSLVFGIVITAVGCYEGFSTGAGAEEVGRSTTSAVVMSILAVVLIDLMFTYLFYFARSAV